MELNIRKEVAALERLGVKDLRGKYAEAFGEATTANNKTWLVKRIALRLQALAEGDLSERARQRPPELANDADLRLSPPAAHKSTDTASDRTGTMILPLKADDRLPPPGTVLTRLYKGRKLQVQVLPKGFEFEGETYPSLSAVAKTITGTHTNGYLFFRLGAYGGDA